MGRQHTIIFKVNEPVFTLGLDVDPSTLQLTVVEDYVTLPRPLALPDGAWNESDKANAAQGRKLETLLSESRAALVAAEGGSSASLVVDNLGKLVGYWAARASCTAALVAALDSDGEGEVVAGMFAAARAAGKAALRRLAKSLETGAIGIALTHVCMAVTHLNHCICQAIVVAMLSKMTTGGLLSPTLCTFAMDCAFHYKTCPATDCSGSTGGYHHHHPHSHSPHGHDPHRHSVRAFFFPLGV